MSNAGVKHARRTTRAGKAGAAEIPVPAERDQFKSVYGALRHDILAGTLKAGQIMRLETVCGRYQIGVVPVREALARLSSEGLVDKLDARGFTVARFAQDEIAELFKTRSWVEELALMRSIANRDAVWEERLRLAHQRMMQVPRSYDDPLFRINQEWEARHRSFHEALIGNCDSRYLLGFCRDLRAQVDRYRGLVAGVLAFPVQTVESQHLGIMEHAIAGRSADAVDRLRDHFRMTWTVLQDAVFTDSGGH